MKIRPATRPPAPTAVRVRLVPCLQLLALSLAVLAACGTTPPVNDQVSRARSGLDLARTDPQTRDLPGAEMHQASEALAAAEAALDAREDMATVDHLAYLAQQRVAVLVEAGNRRAAETAVAQANTEREQMRLQARTQEADRATRNAADSQQQALAAQRDAQAAQQLAGDAEQRARSLQTQLSELNAKKTDRGMVVTIGDVLFDTGQALRVKQFSCTVIGILAAKGQGGMGDQDDAVVVPLTTLQRRVTGSRRIGLLLVSMADGADSGPLKASLRQLMRERRKLSDSDDDNFNVFDTQQLAETLSSTMGVLTSLLGAVAAVSLLVGGIGIMNIMLVSVTERTREIGLRLAVGALESEVLLQFLIEAVVLSALGGLIGVLIAAVASWVGAGLMLVPYAFDPAINGLALVFSAFIGVVFGYFPARRAARMDPIEALRHE
jgi:predicted lysophospholipase L1 biosynthesis ABC-type transport system permease subunit